MKRVDFILPLQAQIKLLHQCTQKLFDAFSHQGLECRLLTQENYLEKLKESTPEFTISFNIVPNQIPYVSEDGTKTPHLICLIDHPFRITSFLDDSKIIIACSDKSGCDYLRRTNKLSSVFMPQATDKELHGNPADERIYDVVIIDDMINPESFRKGWKDQLPAELSSVMIDAGAITLSDQKTPLDKAFLFKPSDKNLQRYVFQQVEDYVKSKDRLELLKSIRDAKVDVFGMDPDVWQNWIGEFHPEIVIHSTIDVLEAHEIMKKAKILLVPNAINKYGAHEKIFAGIACGALVLTNENGYLQESFKDGESIAFYQNNKRELINDQVMSYLRDEEKRRKVVAKGQEIVALRHTWNARAADLLRDLDAESNKIKAKHKSKGGQF